MKIYIAALFSRQAEMAEVATHIRDCGHEVTARWVDGGEEGLTPAQIARLDLEDVCDADICVSFTQNRGTATVGGGRHVEFGYALANGKRCVLIGERENIFHAYPLVEVYPTVDKFLCALPRDMVAARDAAPYVLQHTPSTDACAPARVEKVAAPVASPAAPAGVKRLLSRLTSAERKKYPMAEGFLDYFPDACAMVSHVSFLGNEKHNPGQPTHWARGKSMDHANCVVRHMTERGSLDPDGIMHSAENAWRAMALLQEELEARYDLDPPRGAK